MEDPVKEVADLMDSTKEEGWEKNLANKQVTFVVCREGDQLNVFRVVDRGDGTLTPVSESLRLWYYLFIVHLIFPNTVNMHLNWLLTKSFSVHCLVLHGHIR